MITSTGDSADHQASHMGLFKYTNYHNNAPVYRQLHTVTATQPYYIFKSDDDAWHVSKEIGSSDVRILNINGSPTPPRSGWQFADGTG